MSISASQWGSPVASRRALLIAPNLLGHGLRQGSDYHKSVPAEDLQLYFAMDTSYDVIIGNSLGGTVALALLPFSPKEKEMTFILVDPPLEIPDEKLNIDRALFLDQVTNVKTADEFMAENPAWSPADCVLRTLTVSICDRTITMVCYADRHKGFVTINNEHNIPWSFSGLVKDIPPNVKVTVFVTDPKQRYLSLRTDPS